MADFEYKTLIGGSKGNLEAQINEGDCVHSLAVIICHPHPSFGGTMANNVVRAVYQAFKTQGYPVIRFNFRGVGESDGRFDNGIGEQEDVLTACKILFAKTQPKGVTRLLIIGYSFGAAVGCAIANKLPEIVGYAAISYPFTFIPDFIKQAQIDKPKLFIMGSRDDFTSTTAFEQEFAVMPEPKHKVIVPHIDHFWNGDEDLIVKSLMPWVEKL